MLVPDLILECILLLPRAYTPTIVFDHYVLLARWKLVHQERIIVHDPTEPQYALLYENAHFQDLLQRSLDGSFEVIYEEGRPVELYYLQNDRLRISMSIKGRKKHGRMQVNFPDGQPHIIRYYQNNKVASEVEYFPSGRLRYERDYLEGQPHGKHATWTDSDPPIRKLLHLYQRGHIIWSS
ncbi:MAG: toxin-antitoxin system YwqK family antitoxin [Nitrososphaerales archaeon]